MNQDSQSHRATAEQWERIKQLAKDDWEVQSAIYELCNRVEQLEAALLSLTSTVAKAGNDHKSRIKELELGQRVTDAYIVTAATLSPEERKELGVVTVPEFKAAMARAARQGADRAMTQMRAGTSKTPPLAGTLVEAPDRAGGLVERLAALIASSATNRGAAQDVLREVAKWLEKETMCWCADDRDMVNMVAQRLREGADR